MSFILIRRTNYPLEGEGTSFYHKGKKVSHPDWIAVSKRWHLGPKAGGTFWFLYPDRWVQHPQALWTTLTVHEDTFSKYDLYMRPFRDGAVKGNKGWILLDKRDYEPPELKQMASKPEFYLIQRFTGVIYL